MTARVLAILGVLAALATSSGCAGRLVEPGRGAHGNLHAALSRAQARAQRRADDLHPSIVLVERSGVRVVDPVEGRQRWHAPLPVVGHPVASETMLYMPLRGHKLAAVDRGTGVVKWVTALPGEALTGLAVSEPVIVATVIGERGTSRSHVVALSTEDASERWRRRTDARFGVPAIRGRVVVVPLGSEIVAFRLTSGRESARVVLPPDRAGDGRDPDLERVDDRGDALVVGGGNRFVHLLGASAGRAPSAQRIDSGFGWLFPPIDGLDPGFDDAERVRLWVGFAENGEAPRSGVLLARRAVVAMRLAPDGRPAVARWVYRSPDDREFVAMDVGPRFVTLVAEDGGIVRLDARSGALVRRFAGKAPARGALLLDVGGSLDASRSAGPSDETVRGELVAILQDPDPRLAPAHRLAADLLWRSEDVQARRFVEDLAAGVGVRSGDDASAELQAYALSLIAQPWGHASADEVSARLSLLAERPSFLAGTDLDLAAVARQAVAAGNRDMVPHLVDHLLHPATEAADLAEVARALAELGGTDATAGLSAFVVRYHADPEVVYESRALHVAVDHLAAVVRADPDAAAQARDTLQAVLGDPFTEPDLRAYTAQRVAPTEVAPPAAQPPAAQPPAADDARDPGRIPAPALPATGL